MYEFLSDEWIDAAREIRHQHADQIPPITQPVRLNLVIADLASVDAEAADGSIATPSDAAAPTVWAYIDTTSGTLELELGELDEPDATIMTDHATARAMLVERNPDIAMQSMMTGKVRVQGDMMKLIALQMALQTLVPDPALADQIGQELSDITAPT